MKPAHSFEGPQPSQGEVAPRSGQKYKIKKKRKAEEEKLIASKSRIDLNPFPLPKAKRAQDRSLPYADQRPWKRTDKTGKSEEREEK